MKTVSFTNTIDSKLAILRLTGKGVDEKDYIIELDTLKRVVSPSGAEVKLDEFAGIRKGSEIIITKDLPSLLEL